ncbi:hypothetical protein KRX52_14460 [Pseudomonas sp. MAP12]|uniref:DUF697 domain-containing protein n=1 Tax=Geopseudomonas aromaticivorans TaxID=2849492 RepID=A0ABS6MZL6_9GAMM|nr:hypothetical protein [Pseudomonas aromaticivorans]MBV2133980.1 hypothetical protein [Pseudomonas aromaticivorans]
MLPHSLEQLDALRDECKAMVTRRAGLSAGAAVLPIPGLDLGADVSLLIEMIPAINKKFGLNPDQIEGLDPQIKRVILIGATSIGNNLIGKWVTRQLVMQALKRVGIRVTTKTVARFVPILGQALAASISFGAMKLLGNAHVDDCYAVAKKALLAQAPEQVRVIEVTPDMVELARP